MKFFSFFLKKKNLGFRGPVRALTIATDTVFPPLLALIEKENVGTLSTPPPSSERKNLSAANWISIFSQLATKQPCVYARSHWSVLCLASCFAVETQSGLSAPLAENRTEKIRKRERTHTQSEIKELDLQVWSSLTEAICFPSVGSNTKWLM